MQDSVLVQESSTKPAISANIASAPDYSSLVFAE
jgi:hypothetical protein